MSLPLTRRIAKTVLLTAAGAASVVGTAGAASAAELPSTADVGGLTNLDTADLGKTVDGASRDAGGLAPKSSTSTLERSAPNVEKTVADQGRNTAPRTMKMADATADNTRKTLREAPTTAQLSKQPQGRTTSALVPSTPASGLTESAPTSGLAKTLPGNVSLGGVPLGL